MTLFLKVIYLLINLSFFYIFKNFFLDTLYNTLMDKHWNKLLSFIDISSIPLKKDLEDSSNLKFTW